MGLVLDWHVESFAFGRDLKQAWTVKEFEDIIRPIVEQAVQVGEESVQKAGDQGIDRIDAVLLAGGSSQIPLFRRLVGQRISRNIVEMSDQPMWTVSRGAALYHKDVMSLPSPSSVWQLGFDLYIVTFQAGKEEHSLLCAACDALPIRRDREFSVRPGIEYLSIQLCVDMEGHKRMRMLAPRDVPLSGSGTDLVLVRVDADRDRTIHVAVHDAHTGKKLGEPLRVQGADLGTPDDLREARERYRLPPTPERRARNVSAWAIGIDFGQTTSEAWVIQQQPGGGGPTLGHPLPSSCYVDRHSGAVKTGEFDLPWDHPGYFRSFKTDVGVLPEPARYTECGHWPPHILAAHLIRDLLRHPGAPKSEFGEVPEACLTVPVAFTPDQREKLMYAARLAGVERPCLIEEPVAVYCAYAATAKQQGRGLDTPGKSYLVIDFGGGTTDACVVCYEDHRMPRVIAPSGAIDVGGDMITAVISAELVRRFVEDCAVAEPNEERISSLRRQLKKLVDRSKCEFGRLIDELGN